RYRLSLAYTRQPGETESRKRHFTARQLDEVCPDWRERETYACGPQGLLDGLEGHCRQFGLERRLHRERFHAPLAALAADVEGGRGRGGRWPHAALARRRGRRPDPAPRLSDGYLPHLPGHAPRRLRARPAHGRRPRRGG